MSIHQMAWGTGAFGGLIIGLTAQIYSVQVALTIFGTINKNETLYDISQTYGLKLKKLQNRNPSLGSEKLKNGIKIISKHFNFSNKSLW